MQQKDLIHNNNFLHLKADDIEKFFKSKVFKKVLVPAIDTTRPIFKALILHGFAVANKSLSYKGPEINRTLLVEGSMLHDIGCIFTYAPKIDCFGKLPYLAHGVLGANLLEEKYFPVHAKIARNHIGAGLKKKDIELLSLPIPIKDYKPESKEEILIAWADKFFSKGNINAEDLLKEKKLDKIIKNLNKHGKDKAKTFRNWHEKITSGSL